MYAALDLCLVNSFSFSFSDLVYNKDLHVCDYVFAVPPPCGTNGTETV